MPVTQAEKELKAIFNNNGFDKPAIEYPIQLFMDVLEWHDARMEQIVEADYAQFTHALSTISGSIREGKVEIRTLPLLIDTISQHYTLPKNGKEVPGVQNNIR